MSQDNLVFHSRFQEANESQLFVTAGRRSLVPCIHPQCPLYAADHICLDLTDYSPAPATKSMHGRTAQEQGEMRLLLCLS